MTINFLSWIDWQYRFPIDTEVAESLAPLLTRLATLVPPPGYPIVIYHGVLAPHAKRLRAVVPKPPGVVHVPSARMRRV